MALSDDINSKNLIRGLGFREITLAQKEEDLNDNLSTEKHSFLKKLIWRLNAFLVNLSEKSVVVDFIVELFKYIFIRSRIVLIIFSIIGELASVYFDSIKSLLVNKLFWGRGKLFKVTTQLIGGILVLFVIISYSYRTATADSIDYVFSNVYAYQKDVLIQGASANTQVPKDRGRLTSEKYIVKVGDTLSTIATSYGLTTDTLLWANDLTSSALIRPGDELLIPPGNGLNVSVKKGDTLETLAKKYDSNPQTIAEVNWLDYPFDLKVGQELFIPDGKPPVVPTVSAPVYSGVIYTKPSTGLSSSPVIPGVGRFLGWPVAGGGVLTQCYGAWHNGVDIADARQPSIIASAAGTVSFAGCQSGGCPTLGSLTGGWGLAWTVVVDHGNGLSSVYGHLSAIYVSSGQTVAAGQALGKMGATGTAYGVHVHYMLLQGGSWRGINPSPYMTTHICGY